jgi:hypothetical protein
VSALGGVDGGSARDMAHWGMVVLFVAAALVLHEHGQRWPAVIAMLALITLLAAVVVVVLGILGALRA